MLKTVNIELFMSLLMNTDKDGVNFTDQRSLHDAAVVYSFDSKHGVMRLVLVVANILQPQTLRSAVAVVCHTS